VIEIANRASPAAHHTIIGIDAVIDSSLDERSWVRIFRGGGT
jgi:hypothetical protein